MKHTKKLNFRFLAKIFWAIAHLLIYHERPERIAHGCSFVMSNLSDSLTVAHLATFMGLTSTDSSKSLSLNWLSYHLLQPYSIKVTVGVTEQW